MGSTWRWLNRLTLFTYSTLKLATTGLKRSICLTMNDVLLGVFSASLTRYLSRRYGGFLLHDMIILWIILRLQRSLLIGKKPRWKSSSHFFSASLILNSLVLRYGNQYLLVTTR